MSFNHGLKPGMLIDNDKLVEIFGCSTQSGMRRSHRANSLVIISDHTKSFYEDRWDGKVFHYTGMGLTGDQDIDFAQNKTAAHSKNNGVEMYLFEVFLPKQYMFVGPVELADLPYQEMQLDKDKNLRKVWVFPLQLTDNYKPLAISESILKQKQTLQDKKAQKLTDEELAKRAKKQNGRAGRRRGLVTVYDRDPYVSEFAKRRAHGICQLCEEPAPFEKNKIPFLETHHVEWLSRGGEDRIENTVALCPNCHRRMHALELPQDIAKIKLTAKSLII